MLMFIIGFISFPVIYFSIKKLKNLNNIDTRPLLDDKVLDDFIKILLSTSNSATDANIQDNVRINTIKKSNLIKNYKLNLEQATKLINTIHYLHTTNILKKHINYSMILREHIDNSFLLEMSK